MIFTAAVAGVTSYFANWTINDWFSVDIPVYVICSSRRDHVGLAWFDIELTAKVLGVCLLAEVVALLDVRLRRAVPGRRPTASRRP